MKTEDRAVPAEVADVAGDDIRGLMQTIRDRVSEVLVATERAATDVVKAANADADRIVRDTHANAKKLADARIEKIGSLIDSVADKASTLDGEIDGLRELVEKSIEALGKDLGVEAETAKTALPDVSSPNGSADASPTSGSDADPEVETEEPSGSVATEEAKPREKGGRDRSEAVRVLAAQMLAAGHSPEEAERRLTEEFGVEDPSFALSSAGFRTRRFRRR
jgi:hypothetical protein